MNVANTVLSIAFAGITVIFSSGIAQADESEFAGDPPIFANTDETGGFGFDPPGDESSTVEWTTVNGESVALYGESSGMCIGIEDAGVGDNTTILDMDGNPIHYEATIYDYDCNGYDRGDKIEIKTPWGATIGSP